MKLLTDEGFDKLLDVVLVSDQIQTFDNKLSRSLRLDTGGDLLALERLRNLVEKAKVGYFEFTTSIIIPRDQWFKLVDPACFEEKAVWIGAQEQIYLVEEMSQQHLSNIIHTLEQKLEDQALSKEEMDDFFNEIETLIVPELQKRFKGELLPYKPFYDWEKKRQ